MAATSSSQCQQLALDRPGIVGPAGRVIHQRVAAEARALGLRVHRGKGSMHRNCRDVRRKMQRLGKVRAVPGRIMSMMQDLLDAQSNAALSESGVFQPSESKCALATDQYTRCNKACEGECLRRGCRNIMASMVASLARDTRVRHVCGIIRKKGGCCRTTFDLDDLCLHADTFGEGDVFQVRLILKGMPLRDAMAMHGTQHPTCDFLRVVAVQAAGLSSPVVAADLVNPDKPVVPRVYLEFEDGALSA